VDNLRDFFGRFAPAILATQYGPEIWQLYEKGQLAIDSPLTGRFQAKAGPVDLGGVLREIDDARDEDAARRLRQQQAG
jgi:RIO kinase 1